MRSASTPPPPPPRPGARPRSRRSRRLRFRRPTTRTGRRRTRSDRAKRPEPGARDRLRPRGGDGGEYQYRDDERGEPKTFRQRRPDDAGGWTWKLGGVRRVLYRLPDILAADPAVPIFMAEGEKDVDNLIALGLVATTNPGGAGKWHPEYNDGLRG